MDRKLIHLTLIGFILFSLSAFAQDTCQFRIMNTSGQPLKGVTLTSQHTEKPLISKVVTNATGTAIFILKEPGTYIFSYLTVKNAASHEVKENYTGTRKESLLYDPEHIFDVKPKMDRNGVDFKQVPALQLSGRLGAIKVIVNVRKQDGNTKVLRVPVKIVDLVGKISYNGNSNDSGSDTFYVQMDRDYEIDVDGIIAFKRFSLSNDPYLVMEQTVFYERTFVDQQVKGDTIRQVKNLHTSGTSTHLLFTFKLTDYNGIPLSNEPVFADAINSKTIYAAKTDNAGICTFMLRREGNYIINLKYERGVHLVEATNTDGFEYASITRRYRGSSAIEKMVANRKMNEDGFVVDHKSTPVRPLAKPQGFMKKMGSYLSIKFGSSGPIGTAAVANERLFTQQGFYSPNLYCLKAGSGEFLWGVELGESGVSPLVHHNGVLLVNTYSCTLYALDAANGKPLWSKWLAGTIYSTPSADGNSVFVIYDNGRVNPLKPENRYVLSSFDLRTGKVNWMSWVDSDVIACPVVIGNNVHVASRGGNYYVFDKISGKIGNLAKEINAV